MGKGSKQYCQKALKTAAKCIKSAQHHELSGDVTQSQCISSHSEKHATVKKIEHNICWCGCEEGNPAHQSINVNQYSHSTKHGREPQNLH